MTSRTPETPEERRAAELFDAWLAESPDGDEAKFEASCAANPECATELRELFAAWKRGRELLRLIAAHASLRDRLIARFGRDVDPKVSLEPEPAQDSGSAWRGVLERLQLRASGKSRYVPKGEHARGAMGAILRVWDEDLRRVSAKKVLLAELEPEYAPSDRVAQDRLVGRFLEEAQITAQLEHPGIVPVHELGLDAAGRLYFTMRLVKGRDLKRVFEMVARGEEGWNVTRALGVLLRVCEAMAFAHEKGVVHRDLKPSNVMVGRYGETYVMDWGLARVLGREDVHDVRIASAERSSATHVRTDRRDAAATPDSPLVTMDGDVVGTPSFMSPEQARGELARIGPASDVYAVGAMLYQLLAERMPYEQPGVAISPHSVWRFVLDGPPKPIGELAPDVPPELVAICEKAMARELDARYPDMAALAADLRAYLENRVVRAYETGALAEGRKWIRRNRGTAAAVAALLVVLVASGFVAAGLERARRGELQSRVDEREALALEAEVENLGPIGPSGVPRMQAWLERARRLVANHPVDEREVEAARKRAAEARTDALKVDDELKRLQLGLDNLRAMQTQLTPELPIALDGIAEKQAAYSRLRSATEAATDGSPERQALRERLEVAKRDLVNVTSDIEAIKVELPDLPARIRAAELRIERHRVRPDGDSPRGDSVWSDAGLLAFGELTRGEESYIAEVEARLASAKSLAARSVDAHTEAWSAASASIRDTRECPLYEGLVLEPQLGLVPLRRDPHSTLWEFWHVASGARPVLGPDDRWLVRPETGIVLILVPGGVARLSAQVVQKQVAEPAAASAGSLPIVEDQVVGSVRLDPYFLSKYELTQGQYLRLAGENPSDHVASRFAKSMTRRVSRTHPVETVSWTAANRVLADFGLELPTDAQHEFACRAGTSTAYWFGPTFDATRVNFRDRLAAIGLRDPKIDPALASDGWTVGSPGTELEFAL